MGEIVRGRFLVTRWGPPVGVVEDGKDAVTDLYGGPGPRAPRPLDGSARATDRRAPSRGQETALTPGVSTPSASATRKNNVSGKAASRIRRREPTSPNAGRR